MKVLEQDRTQRRLSLDMPQDPKELTDIDNFLMPDIPDRETTSPDPPDETRSSPSYQSPPRDIIMHDNLLSNRVQNLQEIKYSINSDIQVDNVNEPDDTENYHTGPIVLPSVNREKHKNEDQSNVHRVKPRRKATQKVQSYAEPSLRKKMRRKNSE